MSGNLLKTARHSLALLVLTFFLGNIFLYVMNFQLNHNEHMYVTAGVLIQRHRLYQDFSYLQMPYLPMLYGLTYALSQSTYYFFIARLYTFIFVVISTLTLYLISVKISKSAFVSIIVVIFFLANEATIETTQESSNYIISSAFSLLALYTFLQGTDNNVIAWKVALSGLCCAVAFGAKLYYGVIILAFVLVLCVDRSLLYKKKTALWFVIGVMVGLLPVCYYFVSDPDAFIFNNLLYHTLNTAYVLEKGDNRTTLLEKIYYAWRMLVRPLTWLTLVCVIVSAGVLGKQIMHHSNVSLKMRSDTLLICALSMLTTITVFIPTPLQKVYLSMPMPFLALLISCVYRYLTLEHKRVLYVLLGCQVGICFWLGGPQQYFAYADTLYDSDTWTVFAIHQTAENIRTYSEITDSEQKIATFSPIYTIEAQINTYKELSSGPFLYRISDRISDADRQHFVATSPHTVADLFAKDPPKAIFVGFEDEDDLDPLFVQYAKEHHYSKIRKKFDGGTLYVRQAQ